MPSRPTIAAVRRALRQHADADRAKHNVRYFRTGPGEYGEGDRFFGVTMPDLRRLVPLAADLAESDVLRLLHSKWHEERMLALLVLVRLAARADDDERDRIARLYLSQTEHINNWDLVDVSAPLVLGPWIATRDRRLLDRPARSDALWERRIAILTTLHLIREGEYDDTLRLAEILLDDPHDLIHKASGWMLREVGKKDVATLRRFLRAHAHRMPRTMLRYAIERLSAAERKRWMERKSAGKTR